MSVRWVFHGSDLQALEVFGHFHIALAVGHVPEAVFGPGQRLEALGVELGQHFLADRAVQHRAGVCLVAEQEGHIENFCLGHKVGNRSCGAESQFLRAQLHRFNRLAFAAERAVVEGLHFVSPAGALFNLFGKGVDGHALVRILRGRDADAHGGLGAGTAHKSKRQSQAKGDFGQLHAVIS